MTPEDLALQMSRMKERFAELDAKLADPGIYARQYECRVLSAERRRLGDLFRLHDDWTKALRELHENRELVGGLRWVEEPSSLRFFFGRLEPTSNWQDKLVEKFRADFGESL